MGCSDFRWHSSRLLAVFLLLIIDHVTHRPKVVSIMEYTMLTTNGRMNIRPEQHGSCWGPSGSPLGSHHWTYTSHTGKTHSILAYPYKQSYEERSSNTDSPLQWRPLSQRTPGRMASCSLLPLHLPKRISRRLPMVSHGATKRQLP